MDYQWHPIKSYNCKFLLKFLQKKIAQIFVFSEKAEKPSATGQVSVNNIFLKEYAGGCISLYRSHICGSKKEENHKFPGI